MNGSKTPTYTTNEAADLLGVSRRTAYRYSQDGTLKPTKKQPLRFSQSNINAASKRIAAAAR